MQSRLSMCMGAMIDFQPFFAMLGADEAAGESAA
jgi:hypothetical protein